MDKRIPEVNYGKKSSLCALMMATTIQYEEFIRIIRTMTPRSKTFKIVKAELSKLGHWKNKPRGNPKKGYQRMKEKGR